MPFFLCVFFFLFFRGIGRLVALHRPDLPIPVPSIITGFTLVELRKGGLLRGVDGQAEVSKLVRFKGRRDHDVRPRLELKFAAARQDRGEGNTKGRGG